jgi:hypothetical protein
MKLESKWKEIGIPTQHERIKKLATIVEFDPENARTL